MINQRIKQLAELSGYTVSRSQAGEFSDRIEDFIRSMWPVETDFELFRAGGTGDGAYLVPDDLDGIAALFSPGVDRVAEFEEEMAARGMNCYLADASVKSPPVENPRFRFERKFLGLVDAGDFMTIDNWVERNEPGDRDLMLQMDIEGAEWTVLANMSAKLLSRFRVIVIEFHWLEQMWSGLGSKVMIDVIGRILATHHVVHAHPNNYSGIAHRRGVGLPELLEVTFLRKDRSIARGYATRFPHPLDILNVRERLPVDLPSPWHAPGVGLSA